MRIRTIIRARRLAEQAAQTLRTAEQDKREGYHDDGNAQANETIALLELAIEVIRAAE